MAQNVHRMSEIFESAHVDLQWNFYDKNATELDLAEYQLTTAEIKAKKLFFKVLAIRNPFRQDKKFLINKFRHKNDGKYFNQRNTKDSNGVDAEYLKSLNEKSTGEEILPEEHLPRSLLRETLLNRANEDYSRTRHPTIQNIHRPQIVYSRIVQTSNSQMISPAIDQTIRDKFYLRYNSLEETKSGSLFKTTFNSQRSKSEENHLRIETSLLAINAAIQNKRFTPTLGNISNQNVRNNSQTNNLQNSRDNISNYSTTNHKNGNNRSDNQNSYNFRNNSYKNIEEEFRAFGLELSETSAMPNLNTFVDKDLNRLVPDTMLSIPDDELFTLLAKTIAKSVKQENEYIRLLYLHTLDQYFSNCWEFLTNKHEEFFDECKTAIRKFFGNKKEATIRLVLRVYCTLIELKEEHWGFVRESIENISYILDELFEDYRDGGNVLLSLHLTSYLAKYRYRGETDQECPICLVQMNRSKILLRFPCKHTFHQSCLVPWLKNENLKCPTCRGLLKNKPLDGEEFS